MERLQGARFAKIIPALAAYSLIFLGGMAASRLLFEHLFPRWLWLGRPIPVLFLSAAFGALILGIWRARFASIAPSPALLFPLLPILLFLVDPAVNLIGSRFIFAASIWLVALITARHYTRAESWHWLGILFVLLALIPVYLLTMPNTVGRADTFEFQVVVPQLGIAHPTGYPLYMLLGKLFALLPGGTVAWRLNLGSAVFALIAASLVYLTCYRLLNEPVAAVLGAVSLGFSVTFWSQGIVAEVYSLHALVVSLALFLMILIDESTDPVRGKRLFVILLLVVGLGLTNHLTSLFLLPAVALLLLFQRRNFEVNPPLNVRMLLQWAAALLLPLALYAYLPIRWAAVNDEPMGLERFIDWVVGGRFQGALQWDAWLKDPTRYEILVRLFVDNWGWLGVALAGIGIITLLVRRPRTGWLLFVTWLGFTFYALNYYVPDLDVFLIPAQVILAIGWAAGIETLLRLGDRVLARVSDSGEDGPALRFSSRRAVIGTIIMVALVTPLLSSTAGRWHKVDKSGDDSLTEWGHGVLSMPLDDGAAILADSEKIAPLYYLQQSEGLRPDLDIMVLPDEAAYRSELDARVAAGQTVYLARFLPGLAGVYHLNSFGPLIAVSTEGAKQLPESATPSTLSFGPIDLVGYAIEPVSSVDSDSTAITLYWRADVPVDEFLQVYLRANSVPPSVAGQNQSSGRHPANDSYPTVAWKPGEIVADFHLMPRPVNTSSYRLEVQVALSPPFTAPGDLSWQTLTSIILPPSDGFEPEHLLRAQIGTELLRGVEYPSRVRPQTDLPVVLAGFGSSPDRMVLSLRPWGTDYGPVALASRTVAANQSIEPFTHLIQLHTDLSDGKYELVALATDGAAVCGWMAAASEDCVLGLVEISGAPLPAGATNFEDKIALLSVDVGDRELEPGGQLEVNLVWTGLAPMDEDYTVFVQVLDAGDRIVGQVDAWPQQGTYPTSQWQVGEPVDDPYTVQLESDLDPGIYRLQVGWYLLSTLRRLAVLDETGMPTDDKVLIAELNLR